MLAKSMNPILNVSNLQESFAWFAKLGWEKTFEWGNPPGFGGVCSGDFTIFMCVDAQGGRGKGPSPVTFGPNGDERGDKGVWISIGVESADAVYESCLKQGIEVTWPPTDMPWSVREVHLRHPDGHVFRVSQSLEEEED
ncbi:MAG: bleomycin resistance family protein [Acidobacteriota bacterium]